jgi:hypothetical protein
LSQKRRAQPCLEPQDAEALARAINAEPWEPLPGMVKRQCPVCRYFFAALPDAAKPLCPDCVAFGTRPASADPT